VVAAVIASIAACLSWNKPGPKGFTAYGADGQAMATLNGSVDSDGNAAAFA
jgi:hypothetical protein